LLEEREASLVREQRIFSQSCGTFAAESQRDRERLNHEREAWDQEQQAQQAEIRRQQNMLALHAENLEARRERLDTLRAELEETHRGTLEMRMAVEEAWAQLSQTAGTDIAHQRVDEARNALSEHYRLLREAQSRQRSELLETQTRLQQQKDEFRAERQTFTEWTAERDEKLRLWEQRLGQDAAEIDVRDAAWRAARDRWMQEKVEAEHVIRDLLAQLTELNNAEDETESLPGTDTTSGVEPA